jgi:hypothetical protein
MQDIRSSRQHNKQRQQRSKLLAIVEDLLRGAGAPLADVYLREIEHDVDTDAIAVTASSTIVSRPRFGSLFRR